MAAPTLQAFLPQRHREAELRVCGYANGVFAYAREITGRTETYWCPIKHGKRTRDAHPYFDDFAAYGDAPGYKRRLRTLRRSLKK